jgi:hypothetical protein
LTAKLEDREASDTLTSLVCQLTISFDSYYLQPLLY